MLSVRSLAVAFSQRLEAFILALAQHLSILEEKESSLADLLVTRNIFSEVAIILFNCRLILVLIMLLRRLVRKEDFLSRVEIIDSFSFNSG